jgi:hypothetical protein
MNHVLKECSKTTRKWLWKEKNKSKEGSVSLEKHKDYSRFHGKKDRRAWKKNLLEA